MSNLMENNVAAEEVSESSKEGPQNFENLLDVFTPEQPRRGQFLHGEVLRVDGEEILLDVGAKRDALVTPKEMGRLDEDLVDNIEPGDEFPVFVLKTPARGEQLLVSIERGLEQEDWKRAEKRHQNNEVLELHVIGLNRGGLEVEFGRLNGFIPNSQIPDLPRGTGKEEVISFKKDKVGTELLCKVLEVNRRKRRLIFSGRAAQQERRKKRLKELKLGEVIEGKVVNIVDFGAFVDLGGVDGLIHISELERRRVDHPSDVVSVGEDVAIKVIDVDVDRERVSLSRKALLPSPWDSVEEKYSVGDLVEGEVTNVRDFGAFVMLSDGIEGMIHTSEIGAGGVGRPEDVVRSGDRVLVRITRIEPDRERMGLSLRQVTYDEQVAWMEEMKATEKESQPAEEEEQVSEESAPATQEAEPQAAEEVAEAADEAEGEISEEPTAEKEAPEEAAATAEEAEPQAAEEMSEAADEAEGESSEEPTAEKEASEEAAATAEEPESQVAEEMAEAADEAEGEASEETLSTAEESEEVVGEAT